MHVTNPRHRTLPCVGQITLAFRHRDPDADPLREHLSCVVAAPDGRTLWLTSDETAAVERLVLADDGTSFADHESFDLRALLDLPGEATEEADIEGLALSGGCLWVAGSHSLARRKPKKSETREAKLELLSDIKLEANRFLLGRIPLLASDEGGSTLAKSATNEAGDKVKTARLPIGSKPKHLKKARTRSALTALLADDPHIGRFMEVPAKENGFDVEGMVVLGERILLGLRGPVLRGYAMVLEIALSAKKGRGLRIAESAAGAPRYRKHFLDLDGLGIRSLLVRGDDVWILAGPTMDLDGPVRLYAWRGGASGAGSSSVVSSADIAVLGDLPFGDGVDHAEGATVLKLPNSHVERLLVVYDGPAKARCVGEDAVLADLFALPER